MPPAPGLSGSTLRQVVRPSLGGSKLRVRLSNLFGGAPLAVGAAGIALSAQGSSIGSGSHRQLTFGGAARVTVAPGGEIWSDPISFSVSPFTDLTVTLKVDTIGDAVTGHPGSRATSFLQSGEHVSAVALPSAARVERWYVLAAIEVLADQPAAAVVALGNSITDGRGSITDGNTRWTDFLAHRLHNSPNTRGIAVLNAGLGGNAVLRGGLGPPLRERFARDALTPAGVRWAIVLAGVNDIGAARDERSALAVADSLIIAFRELIAQARAKGVRVYGATILPFGGSFYDGPGREEARQRVNRWIREGGEWDAVIDFDLALRDDASPSRLRPDGDEGDHLHPSPAGYRLMAETVDLRLFRR